MFKTFAAALLATALVAGAAFAAPVSGNAAAPTAQSALAPDAAAKQKIAEHSHKHARIHMRKHHVARAKLRAREAHQRRGAKTHTSHVGGIVKSVKTAKSAKLPAAWTGAN